MRCVPNKRFLDREAKRMEEEGRRLAMQKHQQDGKPHRVRVIESHWQEWLLGAMTRNCKWLSLCVDDVREDGGKLGVGTQKVRADFWVPEQTVTGGGAK